MQIHDDFDAEGVYYDSPPLCLGIHILSYLNIFEGEEHEEELGDLATPY